MTENETPSIDLAPEGVDQQLWERYCDWRNLPEDDPLHIIQRGKLGLNLGLDNGLQHINQWLYGNHRACYYLIGADSGIGKSTVADYMYLIKPWEDAQRRGITLKTFYCTFEVDVNSKKMRWASTYVQLFFNVTLSTAYMIGREKDKQGNKVPLSPEHEVMILKAYKRVDELCKDIVFLASARGPVSIFNSIVNYIEDHKWGEVERRAQTEEDKKYSRRGELKGFRAFDTLWIQWFTDHIALAEGTELKSTMDTFSRYGIVARNVMKITCIFLQQFNPSLLETQRALTLRKSSVHIVPNRLDFGDSKATFRDANVVLGLVKPFSYCTDFKGYNLDRYEGLGECLIVVYLLKNRDGKMTRHAPLFLNPISGCLCDMPVVTDTIALEKFYRMANMIENHNSNSQ